MADVVKMREFSIPLPDRMRALPIDHRGFPVPWFVAWFDEEKRNVPPGSGYPDFRVIDSPKMAIAVKKRLCWVCGQPLGQYMAFVIGPMCAVNRTISEPPSHLECARFSARCCPFLSQPKMRRQENGLPDHDKAAGRGLLRNPGVACVWVAKSYKPFRAHSGKDGVLFELGEPIAVEWWALSERATKDQVVASIASGFPSLAGLAEQEGMPALRHLGALMQRALPLLPAT